MTRFLQFPDPAEEPSGFSVYPAIYHVPAQKPELPEGAARPDRPFFPQSSLLL
jgi:hypothetical protein